MYRFFALVSACICGIVLSACGAASATIHVQDPWARPPLAGGMMGGPMASGTATASGDMMQASPMASTSAAMSGTTGAAMDTATGPLSAAYMTLVNPSSTPDVLVRASSDVAETVELHTVVRENDVMQMRPVPQIDVPANGQVELKPGGFHVMLINVNRELKAGDTVPITLTFQNAGEVAVTAQVREP